MVTAVIVLLALIGATFVGYPLAVIALAQLRPKPFWHRKDAGLPDSALSASIIIGAYNEERHLGDKLESILSACANCANPVDIWVGDDGSTDATATIAGSFADRGVKLVRLPRGGKAAALNAIVPRTVGDILVFTDADPLFDAETLPRLLAPFADARIGAVAGAVETAGSAKGGAFGALDRAYRMYESALRTAEDRLFGCISADGGLLAIRRDLMEPVPPDGTDDFHISTAAVAAGKRIAFAPHARVFERPITGNAKTLRRRIRITVRGLTALWRRRALFNPLRTGGYAIGLMFHKLARRLAPLLILPLALCILVLGTTGEPIWIVGSFGVIAGAILFLIGWCWPHRLPKPLRAAHALGLHLIGLGAGVCLFLAGERYHQWTPQKNT